MESQSLTDGIETKRALFARRGIMSHEAEAPEMRVIPVMNVWPTLLFHESISTALPLWNDWHSNWETGSCIAIEKMSGHFLINGVDLEASPTHHWRQHFITGMRPTHLICYLILTWYSSDVAFEASSRFARSETEALRTERISRWEECSNHLPNLREHSAVNHCLKMKLEYEKL